MVAKKLFGGKADRMNIPCVWKSLTSRKQRAGIGRHFGPHRPAELRLWPWILLAGLAIGSSTPLLAQSDSAANHRPTPLLSFEQDLKAARHGDALAQLRIGKGYYSGADPEGKADYSEASKWFEAAAAAGSKEAAAWLGNCYVKGSGVREDRSRGLALLRSAADANDPVGLRFLALMYQQGNGVPRDNAQAFQLFSRAVELNDLNSYDRLGDLYRNGLGTSRDIKKAIQLYDTGARLGSAWAQLRLADVYYTGAPEAGLPQDRPMSLRLYEESGRQGNRVAAFSAGRMYAEGVSGKQDSQKAVEYFLQSARRGFPPAQLSMGEAEENGLGTAINLRDAYAWYGLAADNGNPKAYSRLLALCAGFSPAEKAQAEARLIELKKSLREQ
jgi:hypothetical protein